MDWSTGLILEEMIYVKILKEELQIKIGRNLEKVEGLASFGIKARKEELVQPPNLFLTLL